MCPSQTMTVPPATIPGRLRLGGRQQGVRSRDGEAEEGSPSSRLDLSGWHLHLRQSLSSKELWAFCTQCSLLVPTCPWERDVSHFMKRRREAVLKPGRDTACLRRPRGEGPLSRLSAGPQVRASKSPNHGSSKHTEAAAAVALAATTTQETRKRCPLCTCGPGLLSPVTPHFLTPASQALDAFGEGPTGPHVTPQRTCTLSRPFLREKKEVSCQKVYSSGQKPGHGPAWG